MARVEQSIEVQVPIRTAYNQWTQFESFPQFMEGVQEVRQFDDKRLHWRAEIGGKEREWDAVITEQHPDERVAWTSTDGAMNAGVVTFHYIDPNTTRIMVQMDFAPEGAVENVGTALGVPERRVKGDLERFKAFIEGQGHETGAWRGEIQQGQIDRTAGTTGVTSGMSGSTAHAAGTASGLTGTHAGTPSATGAMPTTADSSGAGMARGLGSNAGYAAGETGRASRGAVNASGSTAGLSGTSMGGTDRVAGTTSGMGSTTPPAAGHSTSATSSPGGVSPLMGETTALTGNTGQTTASTQRHGTTGRTTDVEAGRDMTVSSEELRDDRP